MEERELNEDKTFKKDGDERVEELFCYMLGSLTEQIYEYYWTKIEPNIDKK